MAEVFVQNGINRITFFPCAGVGPTGSPPGRTAPPRLDEETALDEEDNVTLEEDDCALEEEDLTLEEDEASTSDQSPFCFTSIETVFAVANSSSILIADTSFGARQFLSE
jgi:hypothetical protein